VARGEVSPALLGKVLQVKELNLQLLSLYGEKYFSIVRNQVNLRTGAILGLTAEEKAKIDLISAFIEKGERHIFKNEDKYWEYKLMQSEARKHPYGDTIFKIIFI
jgi:DNA replication initiation complex subunit (GINS family)